MPLYEYKCDHCETKFEEIQSAADSSETLCPSCEKPARKLVSAGFARIGGTSSGGGHSAGGSCGGGGGSWGGG